MSTKILFFTVGATPTVAEQAEIDRLNALNALAFTEIGIRNGEKDTTFDPNLESIDLAAGTIPTAYDAITEYGEVDEDRPLEQVNIPAAVASLAAAATQQLQVVKVTGEDLLNLTITDTTAVDTTYASDDEAVATVDAAGEVTGVAEGSCTITATHTYAVGKTELSTTTIVVPA